MASFLADFGLQSKCVIFGRFKRVVACLLCLSVYSAIDNLDDMGFHLVNVIFGGSKCLVSNESLQCANVNISVNFRTWRNFLCAVYWLQYGRHGEHPLG